MTPQTVISLAEQSIGVMLMVAGPLLLVALLVGLLVSVVQAATQINESTLSFIPKLLSILAVLVVAGPWMITADEIADPGNLEMSLAVNGAVKQKCNTNQMIMGLKRQITFGAEYYTLLPGDIIMTGTCSGVSQVKPGDVMHCEIEKIGAMDVRITAND